MYKTVVRHTLKIRVVWFLNNEKFYNKNMYSVWNLINTVVIFSGNLPFFHGGDVAFVSSLLISIRLTFRKCKGLVANVIP